jgi:type IV pilus assembly protein PilQ
MVIAIPALAWAAKVTSIDFKSTGATSDIEIHSDEPITFEKQENPSDKQIVLDLKGATLAKTASRNLDTSSFNSKVLLVSPYSVDGQPENSRVVIQLRDMQSANVTQEGNVLKISIPNDGSSESSAASGSAQAATTDQKAESESSESETPSTGVDSNASVSADVESSEGASEPQKTGIKNKLDEFIEARQTKRFAGRPITLKVRDAEVSDVFRLIAEASGFNIVLGDDVKGKITLSLEDVPWDQALDVILHTKQLGAERTHNLLRIVTLANLTAEKQAELTAKLATEASAPRVTRVFPISYAKLDDLTTILTKFSSPAGAALSATTNVAGGAATGGAGATNTATATVVQADPRTNSIIVRDIPENIERVKKLIDILDTQTPQVLIEAKIVEATEGFQKALGGQLGFGKQTGNNQYFASFAGANPVDPLFSNGGTAVFPGGGASFGGASGGSSGGSGGGGSSGATSPGGNFGFSPQFAFLPGNVRLNAVLSLSESENNVRVVSSPRTVVLDKETANIVQSTPVLIPATTSTQNGPQSTVAIAQANLSLNVVPTVTNEGSVIMQLNVSNDVPFNLSAGQQAVANRNITTRVLVESGSTLVMGGIYTISTQQNSSGFPFLRKIPILGALFGQETNQNNRSELFFFITPRILNLKEAGISG